MGKGRWGPPRRVKGQVWLGSSLEQTSVEAGGLSGTRVTWALCRSKWLWWDWATGLPVSFRMPWSPSRMFSHFRALCAVQKGRWDCTWALVSPSMQAGGQAGWHLTGARSPSCGSGPRH